MSPLTPSTPRVAGLVICVAHIPTPPGDSAENRSLLLPLPLLLLLKASTLLPWLLLAMPTGDSADNLSRGAGFSCRPSSRLLCRPFCAARSAS